MNGKKIGIITMHRVHNNGSALQAYALQKKISELGYDCEIIDYVFPNKMPLRDNFLLRISKKVKHILGDLILGFPVYTRRKRFTLFYEKYFRLSNRLYCSKEELEDNPPHYDLLITGSDQVWNPIHVGTDTTFMLSFCKDDNIPRISYSASFSTNSIPNGIKHTYAKFLSKYLFISVRENTGIEIIKDLIQRNATIVCDPTLLLTKQKWSEIAKNSRIAIKQPYILAYILGYAYNPYPQIYKLINDLQNQTGLHVIYLNGKLSDYKKNNSTVIRDAGPIEFVKLFLDAQYVITTSFHGTAFALNFSIPLYSVINNKLDNDSRMYSLLKLAGAENRAIAIDTEKLIVEPMNFDLINKNLEALRDESKNYLRNSIKKALST